MRLKLARRKPEVTGVETFIFEPAEPLSWKAGQFLHYVLHHEPTDERGSDRWFTVASAPSEGHVQITTRHASEKGSSFKNALFALKEGDTIEISDVDGDFTVDDPAQEYVFLAGGIGITPFRSILKEAANAGVKLNATLVYANRDENVPFREEFDALAKENPNLRIQYITGRLDEAVIREAAPDLSRPYFYVSGPEPLVESIGQTLKSMGVPAERLKQDWFPGYPAD